MIPAELHSRVRAEQEQAGVTLSAYMTELLTKYYARTCPRGCISMPRAGQSKNISPGWWIWGWMLALPQTELLTKYYEGGMEKMKEGMRTMAFQMPEGGFGACPLGLCGEPISWPSKPGPSHASDTPRTGWQRWAGVRLSAYMTELLTKYYEGGMEK